MARTIKSGAAFSVLIVPWLAYRSSWNLEGFFKPPGGTEVVFFFLFLLNQHPPPVSEKGFIAVCVVWRLIKKVSGWLFCCMCDAGHCPNCLGHTLHNQRHRQRAYQDGGWEGSWRWKNKKGQCGQFYSFLSVVWMIMNDRRGVLLVFLRIKGKRKTLKSGHQNGNRAKQD